jgi:hypothetical protein
MQILGSKPPGKMKLLMIHHTIVQTDLLANRTGIPEIILTQWYDTYYYACNAESLGIGVYSDKTKTPMVDGKEFGEALLKVVGKVDEETEK